MEGREGSGSTQLGELPWAAVDPRGHPYRLEETEVAELIALIIPLVPDAKALHKRRWVDRKPVWDAVDPITDLLVGHFGSWAAGWNWTVGEGDRDGGVVGAWCCALHSVSTPADTAALVLEALGEWRGWLEDLAERFAALAPPRPSDPGARHWEQACTRLVTLVADRSEAQSGWYGHCEQVLGWFLAYHGLPDERARQIVTAAVGGSFESWVAPNPRVVEAVSSRFATALTTRR
ncbi:hypothetical protein [Streptomyces albipurpureus]|uniref:Uncharacterized protein n=1 Tax=Streptomyces albipurpureus TaxID=2897419 RepID=A0ABT0V247_9ACTN|nr:hypothetical protein [Streptomyces sp. CWNU-1]MCM2393955.1 hypothetical protein [Streptomyces sp. CWNU-1]